MIEDGRLSVIFLTILAVSAEQIAWNIAISTHWGRISGIGCTSASSGTCAVNSRCGSCVCVATGRGHTFGLVRSRAAHCGPVCGQFQRQECGDGVVGHCWNAQRNQHFGLSMGELRQMDRRLSCLTLICSHCFAGHLKCCWRIADDQDWVFEGLDTDTAEPLVDGIPASRPGEVASDPSVSLCVGIRRTLGCQDAIQPDEEIGLLVWLCRTSLLRTRSCYGIYRVFSQQRDWRSSARTMKSRISGRCKIGSSCAVPASSLTFFTTID